VINNPMIKKMDRRLPAIGLLFLRDFVGLEGLKTGLIFDEKHGF
jgi:hypothetical protein